MSVDLTLNQLDGSRPVQTFTDDGFYFIDVFHGPTVNPMLRVTGIQDPDDVELLVRNLDSRALTCTVSPPDEPDAPVVTEDTDGFTVATPDVPRSTSVILFYSITDGAQDVEVDGLTVNGLDPETEGTCYFVATGPGGTSTSDTSPFTVLPEE